MFRKNHRARLATVCSVVDTGGSILCECSLSVATLVLCVALEFLVHLLSSWLCKYYAIRYIHAKKISRVVWVNFSSLRATKYL